MASVTQSAGRAPGGVQGCLARPASATSGLQYVLAVNGGAGQRIRIEALFPKSASPALGPTRTPKIFRVRNWSIHAEINEVNSKATYVVRLARNGRYSLR